VEIEFDPAKDAANIAKHGVSLASARTMDIRAAFEDRRWDYREVRYNAFRLIDGVTYCLTFTLRGNRLCAISLRRARAKEYQRNVPDSSSPPPR
jgi:uncharacterized DUF497 family protein